MRILYLTQWFDPEPNIIKGVAFVRALELAGHEVTVVTGFPNYPIGKLYPGYRLRPIRHEQIEGVRIVRLALYPSHDGSSLRRSLNFLSFFVTALTYCLVRARRYDLIYAYHPPITVGLAAAIAGRVNRVPYVLDVQDLWPDTVAVSNMRGANRLVGLLGRICRYTYRYANAVVAQSQGMARILAERGASSERVTTIYNWANTSADAEQSAGSSVSRADSFTLVYGGNLGRAQGLETVIDAAEVLSRWRKDVHIRLIGDGIDADRLRDRATAMDVLDIEGALSFAEIGEVFARADALLLHLRDEDLFRITIPSKIQAYLAAGRPIVAAIAGEAAEVLARSGAALVVPPQEPQALADAICRMAQISASERERMGAAGRRFYDEQFSFERGMKRTLAVLEAARSRSRTLPRVAPA